MCGAGGEEGEEAHKKGRGRHVSALYRYGLLQFRHPRPQHPYLALPVPLFQVFFRLNEVDDMLDQVQKVAAGEVAARDLVLGAKMQVGRRKETRPHLPPLPPILPI